MIKAQRTYRSFSVLVVFALLFSASVPLAQYVCGANAQSARATSSVVMSEATPGNPCQGAADCHDSSRESPPLTPAPPLALDRSPSCCATAVAMRSLAVTVESITARGSALLPVGAVSSVEAIDPYRSSLSSWAHRGPDVTSQSVSVPIRLFVSVFLL